jgi:hypothetical protein
VCECVRVSVSVRVRNTANSSDCWHPRMATHRPCGSPAGCSTSDRPPAACPPAPIPPMLAQPFHTRPLQQQPPPPPPSLSTPSSLTTTVITVTNTTNTTTLTPTPSISRSSTTHPAHLLQRQAFGAVNGPRRELCLAHGAAHGRRDQGPLNVRNQVLGLQHGQGKHT